MGSHATMKSEHFQSLTPLSGLFELWDRRCQPLGPPEPPAEPGFSGAGVLRIETDRGALAVRSWPTPGLTRVRIEGLHRLLEHVADTVPVAVNRALPRQKCSCELSVASSEMFPSQRRRED